MKKKFYILLSLQLLLFPIVSCTSKHENAALQEINSLLNNNPDSALSILEKIDWHKLSEEEQARYSLFHTIAQDKSGLDVDSDSLIGLAYDYYKYKEKDSLYAKCHYYMGKYYWLNDSNRQAEECFIQAILSAKERNDQYTHYLALEKLSKSLQKSNPEDAIRYSKEAYKVFDENFHDNISNKVFLLLNIGISYSIASKIDSAQMFLEQALSYAQESKIKELQSNVYQSLSVLMVKKERNDSALIYAVKSWNDAPKKSYSLALQLAHCYLLNDSVEESFELLEQIRLAKSTSTKYAAYKRLTALAIKNGDTHLIQEYVDSTLSLYEKMYESMLKDRSDYYSANAAKKMELKDLNEKKQRKELTFSGLIIILALTLLLILSFYRNRTIRIKKIQEIEKLRHQAAEEKQQICLSQKENQILLLKKYIFSHIGLQEKLYRIKNEKKDTILIDEETWKDIEQFLNASENAFVTRLAKKFPVLTKEDLRFCMLLRLDFSIKELSRTYHIEESSVKQKQNKFKKKIGIEDPSISLRKFLHNF